MRSDYAGNLLPRVTEVARSLTLHQLYNGATAPQGIALSIPFSIRAEYAVPSVLVTCDSATSYCRFIDVLQMSSTSL